MKRDEKIVVKTKLIQAWAYSTIFLIFLMIMLWQYVNYIDRRSDQRTCGLIVLFDNNYTSIPPDSSLGKKNAIDLERVRSEFKCK